MTRDFHMAELPEIQLKPSLAQLLKLHLDARPADRDFIIRRFRNDTPDDLAHADRLAAMIVRLVENNYAAYAEGYGWMCSMVAEEEWHFRRHGKYRLQTFEDANRLVYNDTRTMSLYMKGLLLSQVLWANHAAGARFYVDRFLPGNRVGFDHLEVGPGHGLLLCLAVEHPNCARATGVDVSETSIAETRRALDRLGVRKPVVFDVRDISAVTGESATSYDSLVMSELLEHLERPDLALSAALDCLAPGGRAYFNVPINSPTIDHLWLLRHPDELLEAITKSGFEIECTASFPLTGYRLEQAIRMKLTVSCAVVARKPD